MLGDNLFALSHDLTSQFHARDAAFGHNVYMYQLEHRAQNSYIDNAIKGNMTLIKKCECERTL